MTKRTRPSETFARMRSTATDDCLIWPHAIQSNGYPKMNTPDGSRNVHRLMCETVHGPPPDDHQTAHSCGVRACVNPRHLRWATPSENQFDRVEHGTSNRGERSGHHRLTEAQVLEVVRRHADGEHHTDIANRFGVCDGTVRAILKGRSWSWLTGL